MFTTADLLDPTKFFPAPDYLTKMLADATKAAKYPPYNIRKIDDNKYAIEIAVAGFSKQDIEIDLSGDKLTIKGSIKDDKPEKDSFLYHGLALRPFTRAFTVSENVEVKNAKMLNGMLKIMLEAFAPEPKTKKIDIEEEAEND